MPQSQKSGLFKFHFSLSRNKPKFFVICHLQKSWIKTTQLMIWLKMGHTKYNVLVELIMLLVFGSYENVIKFVSLVGNHNTFFQLQASSLISLLPHFET